MVVSLEAAIEGGGIVMRLSMRQDVQLVQDQRQTQKLTPRMIQTMELLQLPLTAIEERISEELEKNPVLELLDERTPNEADTVEHPSEDISLESETGMATDLTTPSEPVAHDLPTEDEKAFLVGDGEAKDFERLDRVQEEYPDTFEDESHPSRSHLQTLSDRYTDQMANLAQVPHPTLVESLHEQLAWSNPSEELQNFALRIIDELDEDGRLLISLQNLCDLTATREERTRQLSVATEALALVQKMDPPGVGARDLRECLLLQINDDTPYATELRAILTDHFDDLQHNRLPQIAKNTKLSLESLNGAVKQLRQLKLHPCEDFHHEASPVVVADLIVESCEEASDSECTSPIPPDVGVTDRAVCDSAARTSRKPRRFRIRLRRGRMPALGIHEPYRQLIHDPHTEEQTRTYLQEHLRQAEGFIESLEMRNSTLLKIAQAIIDHQQAFLERGVSAIEPLRMEDIANQVGVHVATVSRTVDEKWIETPQGILPLRRFFTGGTRDADGEAISWDVVRVKLQEIVERENKKHPLSDDDLRLELEKQGVSVSRRTITKYREEMKIPSSRQRRQY